MQFCPVRVPPKLLCIVFALGIYRARVPIVFLTPHVRAALDEQNFLATRRKAISQSAPTRARTDDDEIVIAPVVHADSSQCNPNPYAILESPDLFDENSRIDDPAYPGRIDELQKEVMWVWCRCDTAGRTFRFVTIVGNG